MAIPEPCETSTVKVEKKLQCKRLRADPRYISVRNSTAGLRPFQCSKKETLKKHFISL